MSLSLVLLAVFALGVSAVEFAPPGSHVAAWWPAAGLAVAFGTSMPRERRWMLLVGVVVFSGAANLVGGRPFLVAACFALANASEVAVAVWWLYRGLGGGSRPRLETMEDLWRLMVAAMLGGASVGVGAGLTAEWLADGDFWLTCRMVIASHAAAVLMIAPLGLETSPSGVRVRRWESAAQWVLVLVFTLLVFWPREIAPAAFAPLPVLVWGALRQSMRAVVFQLLVLAVLMTILTADGRGPLAAVGRRPGVAPETVGLLMQVYLVATAVVVLPLAVAAVQRWRALAEASMSQRGFAAVLEAATGTAIIGTDEQGLVTFFNPGAENLLGYRAPDVVHLENALLFLERDEVALLAAQLGMEPGFAVLVANLRSGQGVERRDCTFVCRDGARRTVSMTLSAMPQPSEGGAPGYLAVAEDVTERRRAEGALRGALEKERSAVEKLKTIDQAKTDFVAGVTHELRTPLASVLGYAELLEDGAGGQLTGEQSKLVAGMMRNGHRLLDLIEDLLTFSSIDNGTFSIEHASVDMSTCLQRAVESVAPSVAGRALDLTTAFGSGPVWVQGDVVQLERMALNLLTNAIKFTEEGGRIDVRLERHDDRARFTVADTGIGIPETEQAQMFSRFHRASNAQRLAIPGTGLGLSIVHSIATHHGGEVQLTSTEGIGTTLVVDLPLSSAPG